MLPLLMLACSPLSDPEMLLTPDPSVDVLVAGERGPHGAALVEARAQARVSDAVPLDIVYPSDGAGVPSVTGAAVVVFVHGGLVGPERYHWLAAYLATRGWVSVLPQADLKLAITEPGNSAIALERLRDLAERTDELRDLVDDGSPVLPMGHSLGGVLATMHWTTEQPVDGLVLLASFPAASTATDEGPPTPVLALTGTTDVFDWKRLEGELDRFRGPTTDARIEGMNHYAWTDDATEGELNSDGPQERPVGDTRQDALRVLDTWIDVRLFGADEVLLEADFPGATLR